MKIGLLSICAMMFMLCEIDCCADIYKEDADSSQEIENEVYKPVFAKSRKNMLKNNKRRKSIQKQSKKISELSDSEKFNASDIQANRNPWGRDKRSYADVVKGVKKNDVVEDTEESDNSEEFYDAVDPEYEAWLKNRQKNSIEKEIKSSDKSKQIEKTKKKRKEKAQTNSRSNRAYKARRNREKKANQDEFSKNWKYTNRNNNYER